MSELLRREIITAARAELDARKPVQRAHSSARDLSDIDDVQPGLDPYRAIGTWQ